MITTPALDGGARARQRSGRVDDVRYRVLALSLPDVARATRRGGSNVDGIAAGVRPIGVQLALERGGGLGYVRQLERRHAGGATDPREVVLERSAERGEVGRGAVRRGCGGIVPEVVRVVSVVVGGVATVEGSATDVGTASAVRAYFAVGEGDPALPSAAVEPAPPASAATDATVLDPATAAMMDAPSALVTGIKIAQYTPSPSYPPDRSLRLEVVGGGDVTLSQSSLSSSSSTST